MVKTSLCLLILFSIQTTSAVPQLKSIAGKNLFNDQRITVSAEGKKGLVVVFLSAKCPCSHSHIDELKSLKQNYSDFSFVGIHSNTDENKELTLPYFENASLPFPVIKDDDNELAEQLKAFKTPHAFILSVNGDLLYQGGVSNSRHFDQSDRKFLRDALDDIQNHRKIKTPEGRTLGCAIPRGGKSVW